MSLAGRSIASAFAYIYSMKASELILNHDGSVYHLHLCPEDVAPTIIVVGDQNRVQLVSKHFDRIDHQKQNREFVSHTGWIGKKHITALSTGIGTGNVDIVFNELDALFNIDFATRKPKEKLTSLEIIRIGTSGSIHPDIHVDEIIVSAFGVGTDSLGSFYKSHKINHPFLPEWAYVAKRHPFDLKNFHGPYKEGITLTCPGFYGPQGRKLRITPNYTIPIDELHKEKYRGFPFTNLEMETAAIYLMSILLKHKAISFNAILANRIKGEFSAHPEKVINKLIQHTLEWISKFPK